MISLQRANKRPGCWSIRLAPVSNVNFFSKTDNLSKIEIYKLYLEVEVLGLDISKCDYQEKIEF